MKLRLLSACLLIVVFVCGVFAQDSGSNATVWLYRPNSDRSDLSPTIYLLEAASSRKLATLDKGQFFGLQVPAGSYSFSWTRAPARAERIVVALEAGQQAYVEVKFNSITRVNGAVVDNRGLKPVDLNNVFDPGMAFVANAVTLIVPAPGMQIPGTASVTESRISPSQAPVAVAKVANPAPVATTLPSAPASASPRAGNPAASITSDKGNLRESRIPLESGEEGLNSPRPFEAFWAPYSYSKWGQMNLYGGELELAIKMTDHLSVIADVDDHRSINNTVTTGSGFPTSGHVETLTYRFGPKLSIRPNERLTIFWHAAVGRTRVKARYDFGDGFTLDALGNGLVISGGGGLDLAVKKWLGIRLVQSEYNHNRIEGAVSHDLRIGSGLVFRIK